MSNKEEVKANGKGCVFEPLDCSHPYAGALYTPTRFVCGLCGPRGPIPLFPRMIDRGGVSFEKSHGPIIAPAADSAARLVSVRPYYWT